MSEQQPFVETAETAASLSWSEVWQRALLQPTVESYETLLRDPKAHANRGYTWMAVCAMISDVISILIGLLLSLLFGVALVDVPSRVGFAGAGIIMTFVCSIPLAAAFAVLGLAIFAGILHLTARALGGTGTYDKLVYAVAAFSAPIALISIAIGACPTFPTFRGRSLHTSSCST